MLICVFLIGADLVFWYSLWNEVCKCSRLREPEPADRGLFTRKPYYAGRTQFQSQQAAGQIDRQGQDFNRVYYTVGRFGKGGLDERKNVN